MIVRVWRGLARAGRAADYRHHLEARVFPELATMAGHRGAFLLQREAEGGTEVLAVTLWDSLDSIRAFAGDDIGRSVVEPEARAVLAAFEETAAHYEVALAMNAALPGA
ncbi:Antibiotic biosynthesis monooxygenase [Tistlia consotensis]|uniref:Antibiotic biosynthesis monooxygenase n=1 Tax=Tistlia consotensis USBA 355 TaxID=560819 RepID=A0A1Y6BNI1_9PROT|nr:antibiotic biosynthesis monooxygenase [Tistlia consotensis]SMF12950.1 Antibiotic biosynthesis monooxygenase [Tistlia consotensis USBA 355]SNR50808.1 Antibiotic biosynthesis monooxygenase [Tistlia consotensis]